MITQSVSLMVLGLVAGAAAYLLVALRWRHSSAPRLAIAGRVLAALVVLYSVGALIGGAGALIAQGLFGASVTYGFGFAWQVYRLPFMGRRGERVAKAIAMVALFVCAGIMVEVIRLWIGVQSGV